MDNKFSVLMSVYIKEKADYFNECMESLLKQTVQPNEIVIVQDGPVSVEIDEAIINYKKKYPGLLKIIPLKQNKGLGLALAEGIKNCTYELIARMDTDDICVPERFERQLKEFKENPALDIVGSYICEFDGTIKDKIAIRKVPICNGDIRKYQKKRSAFNHVTVMFKKSSVLKAGNYKDALFVEDDLLWCDMLQCGCVGKNIDEVLVYVRTGMSMIMRRGGWRYFCNYRNGRRKILNPGHITYFDYLSTILMQLIVCMIPSKLRYKLFVKILR